MSLRLQHCSFKRKYVSARRAELNYRGDRLLSTTTNHDPYGVQGTVVLHPISSGLTSQFTLWESDNRWVNNVKMWVCGCVCVCLCVCVGCALWEGENSISHREERRQAGRCAAGRESAWQYPWMKWQDYRGIRKPAEMDDNAVYGKVSCCLQREIQTVSITKIWSSSLKSALKQI